MLVSDGVLTISAQSLASGSGDHTKWLSSGSLLALSATQKIMINPMNIFGYGLE